MTVNTHNPDERLLDAVEKTGSLTHLHDREKVRQALLHNANLRGDLNSTLQRIDQTEQDLEAVDLKTLNLKQLKERLDHNRKVTLAKRARVLEAKELAAKERLEAATESRDALQDRLSNIQTWIQNQEAHRAATKGDYFGLRGVLTYPYHFVATKPTKLLAWGLEKVAGHQENKVEALSKKHAKAETKLEKSIKAKKTLDASYNSAVKKRQETLNWLEKFVDYPRLQNMVAQGSPQDAQTAQGFLDALASGDEKQILKQMDVSSSMMPGVFQELPWWVNASMFRGVGPEFLKPLRHIPNLTTKKVFFDKMKQALKANEHIGLYSPNKLKADDISHLKGVLRENILAVVQNDPVAEAQVRERLEGIRRTNDIRFDGMVARRSYLQQHFPALQTSLNQQLRAEFPHITTQVTALPQDAGIAVQVQHNGVQNNVHFPTESLPLTFLNNQPVIDTVRLRGLIRQHPQVGGVGTQATLEYLAKDTSLGQPQIEMMVQNSIMGHLPPHAQSSMQVQAVLANKSQSLMADELLVTITSQATGLQRTLSLPVAQVLQQSMVQGQQLAATPNLSAQLQQHIKKDIEDLTMQDLVRSKGFDIAQTLTAELQSNKDFSHMQSSLSFVSPGNGHHGKLLWTIRSYAGVPAKQCFLSLPLDQAQVKRNAQGATTIDTTRLKEHMLRQQEQLRRTIKPLSAKLKKDFEKTYPTQKGAVLTISEPKIDSGVLTSTVSLKGKPDITLEYKDAEISYNQKKQQFTIDTSKTLVSLRSNI